jgi:phenylacetate-CoA ligase
MFIINGVNIWPKTIEDVLLKEPLLAPFYQIVIDRVDALDRLTIYVESKTKLSDNEKSLLARRLEYQLREAILVTPKVEIADPGTLPRFDGKPKVVIDRRGQV